MIKKEGEQKVCSSCRRPLDDDKFYKNSAMEDGMTNECKECISKRIRYGPTIRENNKKIKIQMICEQFNEALIQPEFTMESSTITLGNLKGIPAKLEIPLNKGIVYVSAENLLAFALSQITNLEDLEGHLEFNKSRPVIVITGIISDKA